MATTGALKLTDPNCVDPDLSKLAAGVTLTLCNGTTGAGTYTPPAAPDLTNLAAANVKSGVTINGVAGSFSCPTPPDLTNLTAANVKQGVSINGVTGTVVPAPDLSLLVAGNLKQGVTINSVTGTVVPSPDLSLLVASNLKTGVTINSVTGTVVPAPANCTTNAQVGCVTTAGFKAADLTNLTAGNVKTGVALAGVTGSYPSVSTPLTGTSGAALTSGNMNARLADSGTIFEWFDSTGTRYSSAGDANLAAANIQSGVSIFGVAGSIPTVNAWDLRYGVTIGATTGNLQMDCQQSLQPGFSPAAANLCTGGWVDITPSATCTTDSAHCMLKDQVTGLKWVKDAGAKTWSTAYTYCNGLNYNGITGWRLPSKEEWQQAVANAIGTVDTHFFPNGRNAFWTGAIGTTGYYMVRADTAVSIDTASSTSLSTACVK